MADATEALRRRLAVIPSDRRAFEQLVETLTSNDDQAGLLSLYEERLAALPDGDEVTRLLVEMARIHQDLHGDSAQAQTLLERALARTPADARALDGLISLYESEERWSQTVELLKAREGLAEDELETAGVRVRLGDIAYRHISSPSEALDCYLSALEWDPGCVAAAKSALEIALELRRFSVAEALLDKGPAEVSTPEAWLDLGASLVKEPWYADMARRCLERAVEAGDGGRATELLAQLDELTRSWKQHAKDLRARAVDERDKRRAADDYIRIAELHALFDGDVEKVVENLDRAFVLNPSATLGLDVLEDFFRQREDFGGLVEVLERFAGSIKDKQASARVWLRRGKVQEKRLGDRAAAAESYRRALDLDPKDPSISDLLVSALEAQGAWKEIAEVLERRLAATPDRVAQGHVRLSLVRVYLHNLEEPDRARLHLEAAFSLNPMDMEVARQLEPLLRESASHEKLAEVMEARLLGQMEVASRRRALERLSELYADHLDRPEAAVAAAGRLLLLDPSNARARERLFDLSSRTKNTEAFAFVIGVAAGVADDEVRLSLLTTLAATLEEELADPRRAADVFRLILEEAPRHAEAQAGLERALQLTGSTAELTSSLQSRVAAASGQELRDARLALARHFLEQGDAAKEARDIYSLILEENPEDLVALELLAKVQERLGDHVGLAQTLRDWLARSIDEEQTLVLRLRMAKLFLEHLDQAEEAASIYCDIFESDSARPGVLPALESLLSRGVAASRIVSLLAAHYARSADWPRHISALERRLEVLESDAEKVEVLEAIADVYEEKLVDRRQALMVAARAFAASAADERLLARVERLAREAGALEELEKVLTATVSRSGEEELPQSRLLELHAKLAKVREEDLGDLDGAAKIHRTMLEASSPGEEIHATSLDALIRIAESGEQWDDLAHALAVRATQEADAAVRGGLQLKLGELRLERLNQPSEAAQALEDALDSGAPEGDTLELLSKALEEAGQSRALVDVIQRRIGLAEDAGDDALAARLRLKGAQIMSEALGDRSSAIETWRAVLEDRPADPDARAALEALLEDPEVGLLAARALLPAYQSSQDYEKLVAALELEVRAAESEADRAAILKKVAAVQAREMRDHRAALGSISRAVRETPQDEALLGELRSIAADAGGPEMVLTTLMEEASVSLAPVSVIFLLEAADWADRRMGDRDGSIASYRRVLEIDPESLVALRALHRLLRLTSSWDGLATICLALADHVQDDGERRSLLREAGRVHEEYTGDLKAAAAAYRKIFDQEPSDVESTRALIRLYDSLDRSEDLARVLETGRENAVDDERRKELSFRLAEVRRGRLGDLDSSLDLYQDLLSQDPRHRATRQSLERLVSDGGPAADRAARLLDPCLAESGDHRSRTALREARLGKADEEGMPEARRAELFGEIRRIQEEDMDADDLAFMTACRQLSEGVAFDVARDEAERLARKCGTGEELCEVFEEVAALMDDSDPRKVDLFRRIARFGSDSGFADDAIAAWKKVQALAPSDRTVLEALEKLYQARHDASDLVEIYRQKVDLTTDTVERTTARIELARLLEQVGSTQAAIEAYEVAVAESTNTPALTQRALEQLERLYGRAERWRDLGRILAALVKQLEGSPERLRYLLRLAELFEEKDADPARSLEIHGAILKEASQGAPEIAGALAGLERLMGREENRVRAAALLEPVYRKNEQYRQLAETLEARLTATKPKSERLKIFEELAAIYEDLLGQRPLAFMVWCRAFREFPAHDGIGERLEVLAKATDGWEELASVYEHEIERLGDGPDTRDERLRVHLRLAELYDTRLEQPKKAGSHQARAFDLAPKDVGIGRGLVSMLERQDLPGEVVAAKRRLVSIVEDVFEKKTLLQSIATINEVALGDRQAAVAALREAMGLSSGQPDAEVLGRLAELYQAMESWPSLCDIYERQIDLAKSEKDQLRMAEVHCALGRVQASRLADTVGAVASLAKCLELNPHYAEAEALLEEIMKAPLDSGLTRAAAARAAEILEPRYEERGDNVGRIAALEMLSATTDDPVERCDRLVTLADIHEKDASSYELAFMAISRALRTQVERLDLFERLGRLASKAELEEEEAALLEELLPAVKTEAARVAYLRRYGTLQSEAGEVDDATRAYRSLLDLRPNDSEALDKLGRLNRLEGDHASLVDVLRQQIALAPDETKRVSILRQVASLQEERLSDAGGALSTWWQVLEVAPDDREAMARIDAICVREERWTMLEDILVREAEIASQANDTAAQVGFLCRLADLRAEHLQDRNGAMDLFGQVLELAPGHPATVKRLEELHEKDTRKGDAARILEEVYRKQERWERLLAILESRVGLELDREVKREINWEIHEIYEKHLDSADMAFLVLCRSFNEDPGEPRVRRSLERLADVTGQHEELAAVYEDALDEIGMPTVAVEMRATLARLHEEQLHSPDRALELWEQVAAEAAEDPLPALQALDRLYRRKERWLDLSDVLEREAALIEDPEEKAIVLFRLGQLCAEVLEAPNRAAGVFEALLEISPGHLPALRGLETLYEQAESWEKLAVNIESQLEATREAQARERLMGRLAEVLGERLGEVPRAIDIWLEVLEGNKRSVPALSALERLYDKAERWEDLVALLRKRLEQTVDPREVTRLSARLGSVLGTHLGAAEDAIRSFKSVLERDPRNEQVLNALWEIYDAQGEWDELVVVLKRLAPLQDTPQGLKRIRMRLTDVLARELNKKEEALEAARRFLDVQPHDAASLAELEVLLRELEAKTEVVKVMELRARAVCRDMEALEEKLEAAREAERERAERLRLSAEGTGSTSSSGAAGEGAHESSSDVGDPLADSPLGEAEVLTRESDGRPVQSEWDDDAVYELSERLATLQAERVGILFQIARGYEVDLEKPIGGALALDEILSIEPGNREAYLRLRSLYEVAKRWRELAGLIERFISHAEDVGETKAMLEEISSLQEIRLGQKDMAFIAAGRAFAADPSDPRVEDELIRLAGDTDAWDEVAVILEDVADGVEGHRKVDLLLRLAEVQDRRLDEPEDAEAVIRRALSFDPGNSSALDALAGLFAARDKQSELVVSLEQKLEVCGDFDEQKTVLGRIALIHEEQLQDVEEAIATWRRVLTMDGGDETAINALVRLFEEGQRWSELVEILDRAVDAESDTEDKATLRYRLAQIFEEKLQDDERAIEALRAALDLSVLHAPSMAALERIFTRLERWSDLLESYETQVLSLDEGADRVAVLLKIAALQEDTFGRPEDALEALERLVEVEPAHGVALRELARLLRALERWERLIEVLGALVDLVEDSEEAVRLHLEIGDVRYKKLKAYEDAEKTYIAVLDLDEGNLAALHSLGRLYEKKGKWTSAIEVMEREAAVLGSSEEAIELHYRMGVIHEEQLLAGEHARICHCRATEIDPTYLPSLRALKRIAEQQEDWGTYLERLTEEARHTDDLAKKTRLLCQAGVFLRDRQGDQDRALELFEEALAKTEDDLESAEAAAALHLERENWERTEQLLTIVCQKHEDAGDDPVDLCRRWYKLAYVRKKLRWKEKTLEAFTKAYEHDSTYLAGLEGLGAALVEVERWEEALKIFQTILIHHRDAVTDLEVVEYYWQLGEINSKLGQGDRAVKAYEKALEIDSGHEPSLSGIIRRLEAEERWDESMEFRHRLLEMLEGEEKYEMFLAIGRLAHEKLEDPYQAIDSYLGASRLRPEAIAPLDSLRVLYRETRQSGKRAEMLQRLLNHPEVQADRAKTRLYSFALAELLRDELKDLNGALRYFDAALDADFTCGKAFEAIEAILAKHKRWSDLEQAYVRMIQRIPKTTKTHAVRMGLWRTLGELYRQVLRNLDGAIAAYQVAVKGDPEDPQAIETLAELLSQKPGAENEAVRAFHQALKVTPEWVRVARALLRLYSAQKSYDKAYMVAAVINDLIGDAQPDEETLYKRLKPFAKETTSRSMSDRLWEQALYHENVKGPVGEMLAIIYEQAGAELAVEPRALGLNPKVDRVEAGSSMLYFADIFRQVCQVMGMEGVPLYQKADQSEGLALVNTYPASLVASGEMMGRSRKKELWFNIAKALAFTRPELVLGRLHGLEDLELILRAAVALVRPGLPASQDPRIQRLHRSLQRALSPSAVQWLTAAVMKWKPESVIADVRAYAEGVEHTANRMGILLCGDVGIAKACLMEDKGGAAKLPLRSKVRELVMFCLSEEYFSLREALGLAVEIPTQARSA